MLEISSASPIEVKAPVRGKEEGVVVDPTEFSVSLAFLDDPDAEPDSGDWHAGSWETDPTTTPTTYLAKCAVGPDAVELDPGIYTMHVLVTVSGQLAPSLRSGVLRVR